MAESVIVKGLGVSQGKVSGRVKVLTDFAGIDEVEDGDILVVPHSHPNYAIAVMKAGGLICEVGGRLSHLCIVAMEMGIPCITQASDAIRLLESMGAVTLDADKGVVYAAQKR